MVITDKIVLRQLCARQNWMRPADGVRRAQVLRFFAENMPEIGGSRSWREEPFKKYFEDYQAALFTHGIFTFGRFEPVDSLESEYSYGEKQPPEVVPPYPDADCFLRCRVNGELVYKPIQLKELPPEELTQRSNRQTSLQSLIDGLSAKYTAQAGQEILVVAIYVNRPTTINFRELRIPPTLCIQQLWFFGHLDANTGFVAGGNPRNGGFASQHKFAWPVRDPSNGITASALA